MTQARSDALVMVNRYLDFYINDKSNGFFDSAFGSINRASAEKNKQECQRLRRKVNTIKTDEQLFELISDIGKTADLIQADTTMKTSFCTETLHAARAKLVTYLQTNCHELLNTQIEKAIEDYKKAEIDAATAKKNNKKRDEVLKKEEDAYKAVKELAYLGDNEKLISLPLSVCEHMYPPSGYLKQAFEYSATTETYGCIIANTYLPLILQPNFVEIYLKKYEKQWRLYLATNEIKEEQSTALAPPSPNRTPPLPTPLSPPKFILDASTPKSSNGVITQGLVVTPQSTTPSHPPIPSVSEEDTLEPEVKVNNPNDTPFDNNYDGDAFDNEIPEEIDSPRTRVAKVLLKDNAFCCKKPTLNGYQARLRNIGHITQTQRQAVMTVIDSFPASEQEGIRAALQLK